MAKDEVNTNSDADKRGNLMFDFLRSPMRFGVDLRIGYRDVATGKTYVAKPTEFVEYEAGVTAPCVLHMDNDEPQKFLDSLWAMGYRPTEQDDSAGRAQAMQEHIGTLKKHCDTFAEMAKNPPIVILPADGKLEGAQ